jgi:hypothetical protein
MVRRGISLVELGIAFLIVGLGVLPLISLFSTAGQQARQTADYGLALTMTEKVAEELRLQNWEDIHQTELLDSVKDQLGRNPVVDGKSPFFTPIEDQADPQGLLRGGEDPAITSRYATLYNALTTFSLEGKGVPRTLPVTGQVVDFNLDMQWSDFRQRLKELPLTVSLGCYGYVTAPPSIMEDRNAADLRITTILLPQFSGQSLAAACGNTGARLEILRAIGDVVLMVQSFTSSQADFDAKVATLKAARRTATEPAELARIALTLGRLHEARAARYLQGLYYLAAPMLSLAAVPFKVEYLGAPPPKRTSYLVAMFGLEDVAYGYEDSITAARLEYLRAFRSPLLESLPPRVRIRVFMRLLEVRKLEALTLNPPALAIVQQMLDAFAKFEDGRNPNFYHFAQFETDLAKTKETLAAAYPAPARFTSYRQFGQFVAKAVRNVISAK